MKRTNRIGSRLFIGLTFLFLYLPIFLLIVFSFNAGTSPGRSPATPRWTPRR